MPALDGVRGLAILLVVMHNFSLLSEPHGVGASLLAAWLDRGWVGVQLFFVLSGFLITGILLDTRTSSNYFSAFFGRRVLRIWPLYYATLLVMFVVLPMLHVWPGVSLRDQPHELWLTVYLSNWVEPFYPRNSLPHFWSLAVEEQFYVVWPFLVYRCNARQVLKASLAIAVVALAIRYALLSAALPADAVYKFSVCRMDALALGAAAAAALRLPAWRDRLLGRPVQLLWACAAVLLVGAALSHAYVAYGLVPQTLGYTFLAIGFSSLVLAAACADISGAAGWPALLRGTVLRRLGLYSYAMYVLHVPLREVIGLPVLRALGFESHSDLMTTLVYVALGTVASYAVAAASYHCFEVHFLRLKRHFEPAHGQEVS